MLDGGKHQAGGSIASDWRSVFSILRTRRTKVFTYGFVLVFVACTAYIAFCPSGGGSLWLNNFFATASYRSQFSTIISCFFPVSHDGSLSRGGTLGLGAQEGGGTLGRIQKKGDVGLQNNGGDLSKNEARVEVSKGGVLGKNRTSSGVGYLKNGVLVKNQTFSGVGSKKDGVMVKNQTNSGVGSEKDGILEKNQTSSGAGSSKNGVFIKNETGFGGGNTQNGVSSDNKVSSIVESPKATVLAKNQTRVGSGASQSGISTKNQSGSGVGASQSGGLAKNQAKVGGGSTQGEAPAKTTASTGAGLQKNAGPAKSQQTKNPSNVQMTDITQLKGAIDLKSEQLGKNKTEQAISIERSVAPIPVPKNGPPAAAENSVHIGVSSVNKLSNASVSLAKGNKPPPLAAARLTSAERDCKRNDWSVESMKKCDIYKGGWVKDDSYPLYPEGTCPHIDKPFDCFLNGRPDRSYQMLRWQPDDCNIPRLNATDMLERLRGKRLVFVGDSLNRNMWESLVCALRNSVKDKAKVFEVSGRHEFRTEGCYSFLFKDYGCTVEFFRSPFLVQEWEMPGTNGKKKETLRLDKIERSSSKYKDADVIVFNTGHWWTHEKTSKGKDYYQEGNHVYSELNVVNAFHKALDTWAKWVDLNINPQKTLVFFRGYSASHFSGGRWNSGGQCDRETEPIKNEKFLSSYPPKMSILESVIKGMKTPISYLNITRMTDYRKDAHPSIYWEHHLTEEERRSPERYQDCSHWCLPGVPDSWNELLYAQLLIKQHQT